MKILFVCTGNICRSPLAEGILRDKIKKRHLDSEVDSAGLEYFHVGDAPDKRAIEVGKRNGIDISHHKGRLFIPADFDRFNRILIMDSSHYT
ncbi:MAG: low molecular weight protein-tyrosine-phosphatase, partial [Bacteroidota bacterium]